MTTDNKKREEIEEIQRRIDYLITTDDISDSEKNDIAAKILEIIQQCEGREVLK